MARLSFEDGSVLVTPKDRDTFLISAEKATEACRNAVRHEERVARFESEFLVPLYRWCTSHSQAVRACYIPMPGSHIQVFIVTTSSEFNFGLAEEVAELERSLAQGGWKVGVSQLPNADNDNLATFCNEEGALEVYAKPGSASKEG
jgi:hypothetical protein